MSLLDRITINPDQCGGRPCIRGMRIRVRDVLDMLAGGATPETILKDFPYLDAAIWALRSPTRLRNSISQSSSLRVSRMVLERLELANV
jgi:hypothetical protein